MTTKNLNKKESAIAEKLNSLSDKETFWDDVRKFTAKVHSDAVLHVWEWLSDRRYAEILTGVEDVRIEIEDGKISYYDGKWNEVKPYEQN